MGFKMNEHKQDNIANNMLTKTASDIMSKSLVTASAGCSMFEIAKKMKGCRVSAVFLTASGKSNNDLALGNQPKIIGIVTQTDLVDEVCAKNIPASMVTAESVMSPVITISEHSNVEEVTRMMTEKRIRHLVVCQRDNPERILGIITGTDLAKYLKLKLIKSQKEPRDFAEELAVANALSISEPLPSGKQDVEC
jgi:signal-transduction protein with cAMP-binding, CBS, and nucleotidyltransferase domain